jgi:hypothetical protein
MVVGSKLTPSSIGIAAISPITARRCSASLLSPRASMSASLVDVELEQLLGVAALLARELLQIQVGLVG